MVVKKVLKNVSSKKTLKKRVAKKTAKKKKASVRLYLTNDREAVKSSVKSKQKFTLAVHGKKGQEKSTQVLHQSDLSKSAQARLLFQDNFSLPSNYNSTYLTLIVRDPHWIYAYWEIAPKTIEQLRQEIGDQVNQAAYVLRLYEISFIEFNGTNANHYFDIDVGPFTNSWYINLWSDNGAYCAELGLRMPDGKFYKMVRSNFIHTPRAVSSHRSDLIWMEVKDQVEPAAYVELKSKRNSAKSAQSGLRIRRIYLTDAEIAAYYSRHFYLLKRILSERLSSQELAELNDSIEGLGMITGSFSLDEILQGKFTHRQFLRKIRSGSSDEMIIEEGASIRENVTKRGFFFEIGTELIVYGRTEPDASVTLEGKPVKLRSDGTFSLRYILNDTKIPLGFKAYSSNQIDKRSISTAVERTKTVYRDSA